VIAVATRLATAGRTRLAETVSAFGSKSLVTVSALIAVLAVAGFAQSHPGGRVLSSLGLAAPAERYTELYFATPAAPASTGGVPARSGNRQEVSFVIQNREQAALTYEWAISSSAGAAEVRGKVRVPRGGSTVVTGAFALGCTRRQGAGAGREVQVTVSLTHPSESIDYWTQCHV
jgi:hypothetical protein